MSGTESKVVAGAASQIKIGDYGDAIGDCTDIGYTKGNIEIQNPIDFHFKTVDQEQGDIGGHIVNRHRIVTIPIAEATLDNLRIAANMPTTALVGTTLSYGTNAINFFAMFITTPGPAGATRIYWFPKCVILGPSGHSFIKDNEVVINVEIKQIFDTAQSDGAEFGTVVDSGADVTPPTVALSTPVDGGTVTKETTGTVIWTITEADNPLDENTIKYGNDDNATFMIINTTTPASAALVAGTISYSSAAKTVTFTPTAAWTASDTFQAIVTTGLRDIAGNHLASIKIEQFSVTA